MKLAVPDMISNSYFPAIAAIELGFFEQEGLDVALEPIFPVDKAYAAMRDGAVDLVAGSAHSALAAFPQWQGSAFIFRIKKVIRKIFHTLGLTASNARSMSPALPARNRLTTNPDFPLYPSAVCSNRRVEFSGFRTAVLPGGFSKGLSHYFRFRPQKRNTNDESEKIIFYENI